MTVNEVSYWKVRKEIGGIGLARLADLHHWLYKTPKPHKQLKSFRYAPSIITRCEAEIFNLSIPRFAIRAYLDRDERYFVNLRRITTFADQAKQWGNRIAPQIHRNINIREYIDFREKHNSPTSILLDQPSVADCVLPIPSRFTNYHVIKQKLGPIYGERDDGIVVDSDKNTGTSYLRHIELCGGGLCSQAACFMASVLALEHVKGIYGLADITALANLRNPQDPIPQEIMLYGLNKAEIARFFGNPLVGLGGAWQRRTTTILKSEVAIYGQIIEAYIRSNCPVIVLTDLGRETGEEYRFSFIASGKWKSIYHRNFKPKGTLITRLDPLRGMDPGIRRRNHAVVIVGCAKRDGEESEFIYHDPSLMPYMEASAGQLWDVRCYNDDMSGLGHAMFFPVTSRRVKLPLSAWHTAEDVENKEGLPPPKIGLLLLAQAVQRPRPDPKYDPGKFRLCQINDICKLDLLTLENEGNLLVLKNLAYITPQKHADPDHWVWVQFIEPLTTPANTSPSLWIWDAEIDPIELAEHSGEIQYSQYIKTNLLLGIFERHDSVWQQQEFSDRLCQLPNQKTTGNSSLTKRGEQLSKDFNFSLMSSFCVKGWKESLSLWPFNIPFDFYMAMQDDWWHFRLDLKTEGKLFCKRLMYQFIGFLHNMYRLLPWEPRADRRKKLGKKFWHIKHEYTVGVINPIICIQDRMAALYENEKAVNSCAKWILKRITKSHCPLTQITSFSTYLPGLALPGRRNPDEPSNDPVSSAEFAVKFALNVASALKTHHKQPISTVEIVAGSRIAGTWPGLYEFPKEIVPMYVANVLDRSEAIKNLVSRLNNLADYAEDRDLSLAVELEPGPLFVVNDPSSLDELCANLENIEPSLSQIVGLNCDIAHWSLGGFEPDNLKIDKFEFNGNTINMLNIVKRICNIHISDFGPGHFADIPVRQCGIHKIQFFKKWLTEIAQITDIQKKEKKSEHKFNVSIELEAISGMDQVFESINSLMDNNIQTSGVNMENLGNMA